MKTDRFHLVLKAFALLLALTLSGIYINSHWQVQPPAPDEPTMTGADARGINPMSKTPALDLKLMEALPKSGPIVLDLEPKTDPQSEPKPSHTRETPGFDLNDALSKTGTIKADGFFGDEQNNGGGLFGNEENQEKE